ncbi:MAG TPA: YihY/virulence factor BrkB family protein, partial [Longimicrobiales bacterium]|nr:YihY/virulence factor BrkB family protein [Longimicrobiales bacterium]
MVFLEEVAREFSRDDCPRLAAALSYYTVFALPPMLVIVLALAGSVFDSAALQWRIAGQVRQLAGVEAAHQVTTIMSEARTPHGGLLPTLVGMAALLFGATGAFAQLQSALNAVWEVAPDPRKGGVRTFLLKRLLSFGMVLAVAFLLFVSLVLSALLSGFGVAVRARVGGDVSAVALRAVELGGSAVVFSLLFAAIFKTLPDATIRWREVAVGAMVTSVAFLL